MSLPTRKVGKDDVSAIAYGAMSIAGAYTPADGDEERMKVLDRLFKLGCTNWDTASPYFDSEELLGRWFKKTGNRDKIFLATKFGLKFDPTGQVQIRNDAEFIHQELATSLQRLGTDHVDLYYVHRTDITVPIENTIKVLAEYVKAGKIRYIGLSDASVNTMRRAHAVHPIAAIQVEYSPFETTIEGPGGVLETARELGMAVFAYSPTGRGLATGRFRSAADFGEGDRRASWPRFSQKNFPFINALADGLFEIGRPHNATAAQIALAWLLAKGDDIIPLPGAKTLKYNDENLGAAKVKLSEEELGRINGLVKELEQALAKDDRYPPGFSLNSFVDSPPL